ncbi:MAG: flagellar biosynthesis protein [Burkholderiaceae bacterium]|nr:flagellar biosynthesis protein [Burkholderiaceae bacterium]
MSPAFGTSSHADQAAGLRRMFGASRKQFIALAHNDQVEQSALVIDRLCGAAAALGLHTLVVDAADNAPAPHEMALIDLPSCIEALSDDVSYVAARGLPIRHVDSQGRCGGFLDALQAAAPQADLVLVHAGTVDLTRLFSHQRLRPLLVGADTPRAMTEAYATLKRLAQRPGWLAHDLLIVADPHGPRTARLGESLAECAERFLGAAIHDCVVIDPRTEPQAADARLVHLLRAQMAQDLLHDSALTPLAQPAPAVH